MCLRNNFCSEIRNLVEICDSLHIPSHHWNILYSTRLLHVTGGWCRHIGPRGPGVSATDDSITSRQRGTLEPGVETRRPTVAAAVSALETFLVIIVRSQCVRRRDKVLLGVIINNWGHIITFWGRGFIGGDYHYLGARLLATSLPVWCLKVYCSLAVSIFVFVFLSFHNLCICIVSVFAFVFCILVVFVFETMRCTWITSCPPSGSIVSLCQCDQSSASHRLTILPILNGGPQTNQFLLLRKCWKLRFLC